MSLEKRSDDEDGSLRGDVLAVVRAVLGRGFALAGTGAAALGTGVDEAVRAVVGRRVERALRPGGPTVTSSELIESLDGRPVAAMSPWIGAGAARLARTGRVARTIGGRTTVGLAVRFGPSLYAAVSGNVRGLDAVAARLATRARQGGVDPDPDRVRSVVVQTLTGGTIDPEGEPDHGALLRVWLGDAGRRAVPFGLDRISGLRTARTPEAIAAVVDSVDVDRLAPR